MKKLSTIIITIILLTGCASQKHATTQSKSSVVSSKNGITFAVDGDLPKIDEPHRYLTNGNNAVRLILDYEEIPENEHNIITSSFADEQNLRCVSMDQDAFYKCMVHAYAYHKSVTLSPDMIWLLISQGFARYVNAHPEEMRDQLVNHSGKMDLTVESDVDVLSEDADWPKLINGFASQIDKYTKGDIAQTITADFSTTHLAERVASQITLMESVKTYFEYILDYASCGIPYITLEGTPADWQRVLDKTKKLGKYGSLRQWTKDLEPILTEFVHTAEGHSNNAFWRGMVKKRPINKLKGGGCSMEEPTKIDGWMLKLFPDEDGKTLDDIRHTSSMPSELVKAGFKYHVLDIEDGSIYKETPMELWAGFIGAQEDTVNNMLTPKIGWFVRIATTDEQILENLRQKDTFLGIELRVQEMPEILAKLNHIHRIKLEFTDKVVIPDWFYDLSIDYLIIKGKVSNKDKAKLLEHFPYSKFY